MRVKVTGVLQNTHRYVNFTDSFEMEILDIIVSETSLNARWEQFLAVKTVVNFRKGICFEYFFIQL